MLIILTNKTSLNIGQFLILIRSSTQYTAHVSYAVHISYRFLVLIVWLIWRYPHHIVVTVAASFVLLPSLEAQALESQEDRDHRRM